VPLVLAAAAGAMGVLLSKARAGTVAAAVCGPTIVATSGAMVRGTIVVINHEDPEATDRRGATKAEAGAGMMSSFRVG